MALRRVFDQDGTILDEALTVVFPEPSSFTGEACAELHLHGSRAVVAAVSDVCVSLGLRPAQAGEFTRRALRNEKLNLTQAEGLGDLLNAEAKAQLKLARQSASGALGALYGQWRERIIHIRAELEAELDFSDEELSPGRMTSVLEAIDDLCAALQGHQNENARAERVRAGIKVVLMGPPNAGKSTLLNWLAKRDVAIVSDEAGTTRDALEVHLDLGGNAVTVVDTAGLREAANAVEREGIGRARRHGEDADILVSITAPDLEAAQLPRSADFSLWNKADIAPSPDAACLSISLKTGEGLEVFLSRLTEKVEADYGLGDSIVTGQARHQAAVGDALTCLELARSRIMSGDEGLIVLAAEDCRLASTALSRLLGLVDVEEVLGAIFSAFCIGK